MNKNEHRKLGILFVLMIAFMGVVLYQQYHSPILVGEKNAASGGKANVPAVSEDKILGVELVDVNYWEARFKVQYQQVNTRKGGYLNVYENKNWSPSIGLKTRPGVHSGVTLLTRDFGTRERKDVDELEARMYDPYRPDHNFDQQVLALPFTWPAIEDIPGYSPELLDEELAAIGHIEIYRNVPDYVGFAERLMKQGFPPERMYMMLAVCRSCVGGLIYGPGVGARQLQTVIRALKAHDFPLKTVYFSDEGGMTGNIQVGNSPPKGAKPMWENVDALLAADNAAAFFDILGFPQQEAGSRVEQLHAMARDYIDRATNLKYARELLEQALVEDDSYVPIYLEMARHLMRVEPFSETFSSPQIHRTLVKSEELIRSGLSVDDQFADAYVLLGYVLALKNDFDGADEAFALAEEYGTENVWLYYNKGLAENLRQDTDAAVAALKPLLTLTASNQTNRRAQRSGLLQLAQLYQRERQLDKSLAAYQKLFDLYPTYSRAAGPYALLLTAEGGDEQSVEKVLDRCSRCRRKTVPHVRAMRAVLEAAGHQQQNAPEEAARAITRARTFNTDIATVIADLLRGRAGNAAVNSLVASGVLPMADIERTQSVLMPLIDDNEPELLREALALGADPNLSVGYRKITPLMHAVGLQRLDAVKSLLSFGGDPDLKADFGVSATQIAMSLNNQALLAILEAERNEI